MIGSSKLNDEQVQQIKNLFTTTNLCDENIAEMYNVSRAHINHIRNGRRWNIDERSFLMKEELNHYTTTITILGGGRYSSQITPLQSKIGMVYVILHYTNDELWFEPSSIYLEVPDYERLRERHDLFVKKFI